ncbi:unnamed protein product [Amoebophrya sp. A25]|nr:unnamed protein product [Amoebophrya sp. A25]|eukprot:GSA25T00006767001.1
MLVSKRMLRLLLYSSTPIVVPTSALLTLKKHRQDHHAATCARQSPINFDARWTQMAEPSGLVGFSYPVITKEMQLRWTGGELRAALPSDYPGFILLEDGTRVPASEILLRSRSEHQLEGEKFPLEVQILHRVPGGSGNATDLQYAEGVEPKLGRTPSTVGVSLFVDAGGAVDAEASFVAKDSSATDYDSNFQRFIGKWPMVPADPAPLPKQDGSIVTKTGLDLAAGLGFSNLAENLPSNLAAAAAALPVAKQLPKPKHMSYIRYIGSTPSAKAGVCDPVLWFVRRGAPHMVATYQLQNVANLIRLLNGGSDKPTTLNPFGQDRAVAVLSGLDLESPEDAQEMVDRIALLGGKDASYQMMPWGNSPRTDGEARAIKLAKLAEKSARKVTQYVKEVRDLHLQAAESYRDQVLQAQ